MSSNSRFGSALPLNRDDHKEKPSHSVPSIFILLLLGYYTLLGFITTVIQNDMPAVIYESEIPKDDWGTFSEETATKYLHRILGNQARVAGTVYHFVKTRDLKWLLEEVTANSNTPVHIDWQYVSGNYWLEFSKPHVNAYTNVSNIIAVLEGESGVNENGIGTSILVNCHYDSVPFAIGASDDGVFCASMVEILSKLSRRERKLRHNIIFLFNGAEENVLLGSHGFLQHPWSKNITNVVNLDSAGMNGRPSVFQVTDPRLLASYSRTGRPTAQAVGQFLFTSGIIPSDTDFRIWRDFGNLTGMDIAFTQGGQVYHTRNDRPQLIQNGVIQNAGDMLLKLISELADDERLEVRVPPSSAVYYDYLNLFLVGYSPRTAVIIDIIVSLLGLSSVAYYMRLFGLRWSVFWELLTSVGCRLLCIVCGVLSVGLLTLLTLLVDIFVPVCMQMRYLSSVWLVIPQYWLPYAAAYVATSHLYDFRNNKMNRSIKTVHAMTATRLYLSLSLLALSLVPSLSNVRYVLTVIVLMSSVCSFVTVTSVRYCRLTGVKHLLLELVVSAPLTLFCLSLATLLIPLMAAIMGRSGSDSPDLVMAGVNAGLATLVAFGVSGIELLFSRRHLSLVLLSMVGACVVALAIPLSPYKGNATQRHYWFHTQITTYNASLAPVDVNSGILITKLDPYTVQSALTAIRQSPFYANGEENNSTFIKESDFKIIKEECDDLVYCNLPSFRPRFENFKKNSLFIKMDPPKEFHRSLKLVNRDCDQNKCVLSFVMKGPSSNTITMYPNYNITGWTFESDVKPTGTFKGKPLYVVSHSSGTYVEFFEPLEFNITIEVPSQKQKEPLLEISHHSHKIYHPEDFTDKYITILNRMPEYFNIATFLSFRDNYVF